MSDMNVNGGAMLRFVQSIDYEWLQIIRRLMAYGRESTGNKNRDKELLHSIEFEKAKIENIVSTKFLTVTKKEQERIQEKKKEKKIENNPEAYPNTQKGAKILGEQLYLAIQMKNKKKKI